MLKLIFQKSKKKINFIWNNCKNKIILKMCHKYNGNVDPEKLPNKQWLKIYIQLCVVKLKKMVLRNLLKIFKNLFNIMTIIYNLIVKLMNSIIKTKNYETHTCIYIYCFYFSKHF